MIEVALAIALIVLLWLAAVFCGKDSRDGQDWMRWDASHQEPRVGA